VDADFCMDYQVAVSTSPFEQSLTEFLRSHPLLTSYFQKPVSKSITWEDVCHVFVYLDGEVVLGKYGRFRAPLACTGFPPEVSTCCYAAKLIEKLLKLQSPGETHPHPREIFRLLISRDMKTISRAIGKETSDTILGLISSLRGKNPYKMMKMPL